MEHKNKPTKLFLEAYIYSNWFQNDELTDKEESADLTNMPPLKDDEEVKEVKGLKFLTPNKLLTRLSILLAQTKAGDNLYKLKNEIRQRLYLLYQDNKITKKVYNNLIKSL